MPLLCFVFSPLSLFPVSFWLYLLLWSSMFLTCSYWPHLVFSFSMQPECAMTGYPNPNDVVCSPPNNMLEIDAIQVKLYLSNPWNNKGTL